MFIIFINVCGVLGVQGVCGVYGVCGVRGVCSEHYYCLECQYTCKVILSGSPQSVSFLSTLELCVISEHDI